ncbi:MAG: HAMP domain-containing protein [Caldilineaceae bacterium]
MDRPISEAGDQLGSRLETLLAAVSSVSVRTKIMGIALALTIILGVSATLQVRTMMTETLLAELDNRGHSVVSDLAERSIGPLTAHDQAALQALLTETLANHPDTRYAFIVNRAGQVLAHTFPKEVPPDLLALRPPATLTQEAHIHYENYEGQIHDFTMPLEVDGSGAVRLGLAETRMQRIIDNMTRRLLLTTLVVALVGILAAIFLTWLLTRPILDLVKTTNRVRHGDLQTRAPHWTNDEIGNLADAFNQMISELQVSQAMVAAKEAARSHLLSRLIEAQEDERKRIARELHDDVGQALTSTLVQIKLVQQKSAGTETMAALNQLRTVIDQTLTTVRLLSRQLRPSTLDDLGLASALERYSSEFTSRYPTIVVDLHCDLVDRLPPSLEISLYRIIQEAMTNAARHSDATALSVLVTAREHRVQAIVEDNGGGFAVEETLQAKGSVGLHSMTERTELLDGTIQFESNDDGTTVFIEIPL